MSDRQKGLVDAINKIEEHSKKQFCLRHMYKNFHSEHRGLGLKDYVWECATTITIPQFEAEMAKLKWVDENVWKWLANKPPTQME